MKLLEILINKKIIIFLLYFNFFKLIFKKLKLYYLVKSKMFGKFYIYLPRHLNFLFKQQYERETIKFVVSKLKKYDKNKYFIDVGANIGIYSLFFKKKFDSKIELFEPDKDNIALLNKTKSLNKFKFFKIHKFCLSNTNGKKNFLIDDIRGMTGTLADTRNYIQEYQKLKNTTVVNTKRFDDFHTINKQIFLIKVDVEDHEIEVIEGMCKAIRFHKPMLIIESNSSNIKIIKNKINNLGYKCKFIAKDLNYVFYQ